MTAAANTVPFPVLVRAHQFSKSAQRASPPTVQNARTMGAMRTSGFAELLETYKKTQKSTLEGQRTKQEAQGAQEDDVPQAGRGGPPAKLTLQQQMENEAREAQDEKQYGIDRFRIKQHKCPNPECEDPLSQPEVYADGNSMCPSCGFVDENAAPELEGAGQQDISDLEGGNRRTFLQDGGADNRTGQEWQDDANRDLYVIEARDVPQASDAQRWWANNRMNQAMVWADYMAADRGLPDGFAITHDEVRRIKDVLRAACIAVAKYAPDNDAGNEADDGGNFGSPLVWTVLLALEMIAQRPEGFMVTTEAMQSYATLRALHLYMRKFQGMQAKRYVEMLNAFRTRAKGADAQFAQRNLDRVKTRFAAWHPLGSDPDAVAAKVATFDKILKRSKVFGTSAKGEPIGLSAPVIVGESPGLLAAQPNQVGNVRELARNKGTINVGGGKGMVDRVAEKSKGHNYFRQKDWDRADTSLLKRDPKARKGASGDADADAQEGLEEGMPGADDSDDDSDDDEFRGIIKLSKQDRRVMRETRKKEEAQPPTQPPLVGMSRLLESSSEPMDVEPSPAPAPAPADPVESVESVNPPDLSDPFADFLDVYAEEDDNADGADGAAADGADGSGGSGGGGGGGANPPGVELENVVTELDGTDEDEDGIADRALLLSLDLSDEAFAEQQRLQLNQMREDDNVRREQLNQQAEEEAEAIAAAQEAKEEHYRQGRSDRFKDPRNDLELGKKTPTPSYAELLRQGRSDRPEYTGVRVIRALTYAEVRGSHNYWRRGFAFVREWQTAQREWRAEQSAKLERLRNADAIKEASRQKRMDAAAVRRVAKEAERVRRTQKLSDAAEKQYQKQEQSMERKQKRGKGGFTLDGRKSKNGVVTIRKAENSNMSVQVAPVQDDKEEQKAYTYDCAECGLTRVVKGTKPQAGWGCSDGGYACKRRYKCKNCPRTFFKEGDPSDEYECKDAGKPCMPSKKKQKK